MAEFAGTIVESLQWVCGELPDNINKWDTAEFWMEDIPYVDIPPTYLFGAALGDPPLEFVSWNIVGTIGETGLEWWKRGLSLLLRHI